MLKSRNARLGAICASVAAGMIGLAYASVPLYGYFCQITGFGGTTQRAARPSQIVLDRTVVVRFDANVAPGLTWKFEPVQSEMKVRIGENSLAFYRATNRSDRAVVGTASFNVVPEQAGIYFIKVECFCFKEQRLEPGETVEMPVSFYIDPRFASDRDVSPITHITLSYTFHRSETQPAGAAAAPTTRQGS